MGALDMTATLVPRGPAVAVVLDEHQVLEIGEGSKRFPVRATVNGHTWRTTIAPMRGEFLLGLNRAVRQAAGVELAQTVAVRIELDTAPREVEVPAPLATALAEDRVAADAFAALSFTHRKEYARWVAEAKRPETQKRRVAQAVAQLAAGKPLR